MVIFLGFNCQSQDTPCSCSAGCPNCRNCKGCPGCPIFPDPFPGITTCLYKI
uniref:GRANULINS domain-containing protein n=1 Tax=Schistosoma mansoni TaxID=6183 RepID=A0A5K4F898_SCHMA